MKRISVAPHNGQKATADFICDGIQDEVQIAAAAEAAHPLPPILLPGIFVISKEVTLLDRPSSPVTLMPGTYRLDKAVA